MGFPKTLYNFIRIDAYVAILADKSSRNKKGNMNNIIGQSGWQRVNLAALPPCFPPDLLPSGFFYPVDFPSRSEERMNLENELRSWDDFANPTTPPPAPERYCLKCQNIWTSHTGSPGWNRCPNCQKYYTAGAAERLVEWAALAREQQAKRGVK